MAPIHEDDQPLDKICNDTLCPQQKEKQRVTKWCTKTSKTLFL